MNFSVCQTSSDSWGWRVRRWEWKIWLNWLALLWLQCNSCVLHLSDSMNQGNSESFPKGGGVKSGGTCLLSSHHSPVVAWTMRTNWMNFLPNQVSLWWFANHVIAWTSACEQMNQPGSTWTMVHKSISGHPQLESSSSFFFSLPFISFPSLHWALWLACMLSAVWVQVVILLPELSLLCTQICCAFLCGSS